LDHIDGILGLSPDISDRSLFNALFKQQLIRERIFSFYLTHKEESVVRLGGIDKAKIRSEERLQYFELTKSPYWSIEIKGFYVDDSNCLGPSALFAIVDSGTTLLSMPTDDYLKVVNTIRVHANKPLVRFVDHTG